MKQKNLSGTYVRNRKFMSRMFSVYERSLLDLTDEEREDPEHQHVTKDLEDLRELKSASSSPFTQTIIF